MTEISSLLLLGLGELLLVTTVVSAILSFVIISRKSKDKIAAQVLISRIKEDAQRRLSETHKIMDEQYGFDGDDLKEVVAKIDREEKLFYQNFINIYLKRDHKSFENLNVDFEGSVDTYRTLEIPDRGGSGAGADPEEIDALTSEIEILKAELKITMDTMGNMLTEYALVFSSGGEEPPPQEDWAESGASDADDDLATMPADEHVSDDDIDDLLALNEEDDNTSVSNDDIDDLLALDADDSDDDGLMSMDDGEDDELFDLEALVDEEEDLLGGAGDETVVLSPEDAANMDVDDPDLLLDQIRAEDKGGTG